VGDDGPHGSRNRDIRHVMPAAATPGSVPPCSYAAMLPLVTKEEARPYASRVRQRPAMDRARPVARIDVDGRGDGSRGFAVW
jgi:hypothetical protein